MSRLISRDPFAREEIHRFDACTRTEGCSWCGGTSNVGKLYEFVRVTDGGTKYPIPGKFCSVRCLRSYHS